MISPANYYFSPSSISIKLNVNTGREGFTTSETCAVSVVAGAAIRVANEIRTQAGKMLTLGYNAQLGYRQFTFKGANTVFGYPGDKYIGAAICVYLCLDASNNASEGELIFLPYEVDYDGRILDKDFVAYESIVTETHEAYHSLANTNAENESGLAFYYIHIATISVPEDGKRDWDKKMQCGQLGTAKGYNEEGTGDLYKMFILEGNTIFAQNDLSFIAEKILLLLRMKVLGKSSNAEITSIATSESIPESGEFSGNDKSIVTSAALERYSTGRFLRKDEDDVAYGQITHKQMSIHEGGAQFGPAFAEGLTGFGGKIDGSGNAWLQGLRLTRFLEVPEIRYNRNEIIVGNLWRSPGAGIIQEVIPDYDSNGNRLMTGTIVLKLEEGEIGQIAIDDICQGIYHDEVNPSNNEEANYDDGRGNFKFAGFFTSYFRITEIIDTAKNSKFRYALRAVSARWTQTHHPYDAMHFAGYGNFTNKERQSSRYSTLTYERFLKDVDDWEIDENNIAAQFGDLSNLSIFGLKMEGYSAYLNNIYMSGVIKQFEMLPLRMEIDTQGDQFLAYGESLTVTCHVKKGWDDLTPEVVRWQVVRDSGDPADDAAWKLRDKVKNFAGTIELCHDEDATIDDLGNMNTLSTLFTFTAYLQDGNDTSFTLAI